MAHGDGHNCHGPNHNGRTLSLGSQSRQKTDLTGSTLASASQAAVTAVGGGTVTKATTDPFSHVSNAAYKVHLTKADGKSTATVITCATTAFEHTAPSEISPTC